MKLGANGRLKARRALTLAAVLLWAGNASAQGTASLVGRVADPSGAVVPKASVTLERTESGVVRRTESNADGNYSVPSLDPGTYSLRVAAPGFKSYAKTPIVLQVGQQARADVALELGDVAQSTEVTASATVLNTDDAAIGQVVENRTAVDLPINGRDVNALVSLVPGAVRYGNTFSIGGGRDYSQAVLLDGSDNTFGSLGRGIALYPVSPDSIREFRVITNNYSAEYGFGEGGVVMVALRQGGNSLRGTLFEFARNDVFDARNAFATTKAPLRYHQFGGNVGGPVRRNRTFFFASYEGLRNSTGLTRNLVVPTLEERTGDFTRSGVTVYDPATTVIAANGQATRQPFAGNRIPQNRFDPGGAQLAQLYPAPNIAGAINFRQNTANRDPNDAYLGRLDHVLTDAHRLSVRYGHNPQRSRPGAVFDPQADPNNRPQDALAANGSASLLSILSPAFTSEFRFSALRQTQRISHPGNGQGWPKKLGITGALEDVFPVVSVANYAAMGAGIPIRDKSPHSYQISEALSWMKGKHLLKFGTDNRLAGAREAQRRFPAGQFTFNANATRQPGGAGGNSVASLLLGLPVNTVVRALDVELKYGMTSIGGYFQDDWKVLPGLTVNLGVRYEINTPRSESNGYQSGFDFTRIHGVSRTPGVVTFEGLEGWPGGLWKMDKNNFGPRFGFAWRPAAGSRTVVRGGFGIFFGRPNNEDTTQGTAGFETNVQFQSPDNGVTLPVQISKGLPPFRLATQVPRDDRYGAGDPIAFYSYNHPNPYSMQFNFGLQRELRQNLLVEALYNSNLSHKVLTDYQWNQVRPELMGPGNAQQRRPFPQFTDVTSRAEPVGNSAYHALTVRAERRFERGFSFQGSYTFSKFMDDVGFINELGDELGPQDYYNRHADRSLSSNHIPHRFLFNSVCELPFGAGKPWAGSGVLKHLFGGWSISTYLTLQSGNPFGVTVSNAQANAFSGTIRANLVSDPALPSEQRTRERYFDTAAFQAPAAFRFGNSARTVMLGPGDVSLNNGLLRDVRITETMRFQLRGEFFNTLNRTNLGLPNHNLGDRQFGSINSAAGARVIQIGLKLYY